MSSKYLHIVSFDIPYPADYGGVIDVFYKIKALHAIGVKIILHCFQYGTRVPQDELNLYCEKVYYYKRYIGISGVSFTLPYIIYSRRNKKLLQHLLADNYPILFEGIHTTFYINHPSLHNRFKIYRAHNIEGLYYYHLQKSTTSFFKRLYYAYESKLLKGIQGDLRGVYANKICCISHNEMNFFKSEEHKTTLMPAFHSHDVVLSLLGKSNYCLFHGNLSVSENIEAALFLTEHVFNQLTMRCKIAGKNPSKAIVESCAKNNIELIINPSDEEMNNLITNAHSIVLPTFQKTGMKLKLLNSLFKGRFVFVNAAMVEDTKLDEVTILCNTANDFIEQIQKHRDVAFTMELKEKRSIVLNRYYNNIISANEIISWL